jgi:predicted RNA binding protein YcfA (HicA-like mRNA interferase family)
MKLPRNTSSQELIKSLQKLGYFISRQKGSHIRLTTNSNGEHHITIPNHNPVKIGTLSSIIGDVASHFKQTKEEIAEKLFG